MKPHKPTPGNVNCRPPAAGSSIATRKRKWITGSAFTLLEILVVVAIIALLIAILLPAFRVAREHSRSVACRSNQRQVTLGWHAFLEEHKGRFYQLVNANANYGGRQGATAQYQVAKPLNKYLGHKPRTSSAPVFQCPADSGTNTARPSCYQAYGTSYNTNLMLIGQNQLFVNPADPCRELMEEINRRIKALNRNQVTANESQLVLMGDFGWVNAWHFASTQKAEWHASPLGYNLAFLDGHAEFVRIRKGLHVTDRYAVIPFRDLHAAAVACQQEVLP